MKRFHVHVSVEDLSKSITFYSTLFGAAPSVAQADYAKWMLDDPRVNFAISQRGTAKGIDHLGFQVDAAEELTALKSQLQRADASLVEEMGTTCCYAESDKYWVTDPQGIAWETFHSLRGAPTYSAPASGISVAPFEQPAAAACCAPKSTSAKSCCG
jgi:predicted enzyme related to lactoylglutathione lyase